jgi:2-keto-3-deoxy-L-fuconate dehydrogenase
LSRLQGKTCVVTAAGQGIGRAVAEAFAREGASQVIAIDMNQAALDSWVDATPGVRAVTLDATDEDAVAKLASEVSNATVLVNCVGMVLDGTIMDTTTELLEKSFRINVSTMHVMIKAFLPQMLEQKNGSIINIASVASTLRAVPNRYAYASTKSAVLGLTMAIAKDFIHDGIRCNSISPGTVDSPSLQERMAAKGDYEKGRADFIARQPTGRLGKPEEIAAIAVLMASEEASFMTGENVVIDGGMTL